MHMDQPEGSKAWKIVLLVFVFMLVNYADKAIIGLSSVPIMRDLKLTSRQFGELGSAFFLLFSASGVAVGFLANHVRTQLLMLFMALAWSLALLPIGFSSGFGLLVASRVFLGAAEGPSFPIAIHAVYQWFDDRRRALPTSIVACGAAFGTGVIAPLLTFIIVHRGWRTAFVALGCCGLAWAAVWYRTAADGPLDLVGGAAATPGKRVAYRRLILSRTAVGVFVAGFGAYWVISLNITWLANYLIRDVKLPPTRAAWIVGLPSVLQMLLAPILAWLSQTLTRRGWSTRLSRGVLGALCVVTAGVAMICMCLLEFGILKVCLIGVCFSAGSVIFTLGSTLIGEIAPPAQRGAMLGITNSVQTLAGLCAPLVMGQIIDSRLDPQAGFRAGFLAAGGLVAVLGILAAVLIDPAADQRRLT